MEDGDRGKVVASMRNRGGNCGELTGDDGGSGISAALIDVAFSRNDWSRARFVDAPIGGRSGSVPCSVEVTASSGSILLST